MSCVEHRNGWSPYVVYGGLALLGVFWCLIMFRDVLAPGTVLFSTDDNIGAIKAVKDALPGIFCGRWIDTTYLGIPAGLAPIAWINILGWLMPLEMYVDWLHAIDLLVASFFIALFLRRHGVGWSAVMLGALAAFWLGSNLTLTYAGHAAKYGVVMMACVALYCISRALSRPPSVLWGMLSGGAIGFMFLEQLDVALFFGFVLGAYALFLAIRQWRADGTWVKSAVALVLMGGVGLLLAVSTMLGSYTSNVKDIASMQTESPQEKWDYVTQWSWPPDECIDFIAPGYMGWRSGEPEGPYWGRMGRSAGWEQTRQGFMNFKLENMYLGIIPILLSLFAILSGMMGIKERGSQFTVDVPDAVGNRCQNLSTVRRPSSVVWRPFDVERRAEILFWGCVALVTLLLAFGKFFPLYALFYKLPMVSSIRNPNKFLQVFQLALGILAAYGLDGFLREVVRGRRQTTD